MIGTAGVPMTGKSKYIEHISILQNTRLPGISADIMCENVLNNQAIG